MLIKLIRWLLFPFSVLYGFAIKIRHFLYNNDFLLSVEPKTNTICVGNLSVGGTGKSPMIEFLVERLKSEKKIATLSRGYGRKSKGFLEVTNANNPEQFGDEPSAFKLKFSDLPVYVCEDRVLGVETIEKQIAPELILLDDAFQHRKIKAKVNIVITSFQDPFYQDFYLPTGNLRDSKSAIERADVLIFSKCPKYLDEQSKNEIKQLTYRFSPKNLPIFFTEINYGDAYCFFTGSTEKNYPENIIALTGIANPKPFIKFLEDKAEKVKSITFNDHHAFNEHDIKGIQEIFDTFASNKNTAIITTEKDAVRLNKVKQFFKSDVRILVQPIKIDFGNKEEDFLNLIHQLVSKNK